jgi:hypothetical protein
MASGVAVRACAWLSGAKCLFATSAVSAGSVVCTDRPVVCAGSSVSVPLMEWECVTQETLTALTLAPALLECVFLHLRPLGDKPGI